MKITFIICSLIFQLACLYVAVWGPGILWTVFALILLFAGSAGFTQRVNSWGDMGEV